MATWNSSDVVLTLKGREILSKVQSGNGSITVTRIMTGAGYVPPAQLYLQTAVKDEKQETRIVKVDTTVGGSSVEVQFDNFDLEQPYDLYQLGIYVTHPDYDGEVLYLIAQCDTSSPDRIPLASETPITVHYSLFMEHSNTDNVQIDVNLAGIVYRADFNALEERVDEHTADEGLHFTAGEKEKLARATHVESSEDNGSILIDGVKTIVYKHPDKHPASIITQDANNRFVTDAEKAAWNAKWDYNEETIKAVKVYNAVNADTVNGKTVAVDVPAGAKFTDTITTINGKTGVITKEDIVALGIPAQDTVYTLPTASASVLGGIRVGSRLSISNGVLSADKQTDNNFTDALKTKLDGIEAGANKYTHPDTHPASMITGLHACATTGVAGSVAWGDITGKPSTFAPSSHTHAWSQITDVPNATTSAKGVVQLSSAVNSTSTTLAATASAVKSAYDLAASKWTYNEDTIKGVKVNNATTADVLAPIDTRSINHLPQDRGRGVYADFKSNSTSSLSDGGSYHGILTFRPYGNPTDFSGGYPHQLAFTENENIWYRKGATASTWGPWKKIWHSGNVPETATRWPTWSEVTGKPSTFTPSSHTHSKSDVGLGNVQNYGIATQAQAQAGTANDVYMTPLRVKEAITALAPLVPLQAVTSDPSSPAVGRIWLRTDLV